MFTSCSFYVIVKPYNIRRKAMAVLKEREQKILNYMKEEIRTKGYPPTVREICAALGIKSASTAHKDIENLVRQGYLVKDPSKPRALMVVDPLSGKHSGKEAEHHDDYDISHNIVSIPVVGNVAAGTPILAEENIEEFFPIPAQYATGGTNYMLHVRGESMIEAGIMDGDLILVQQTETASNGEIVVAMLDGFESEATVKTFYKENGHIRLQPENSSMSPIIVKDVKILGKVKGVFRYFN